MEGTGSRNGDNSSDEQESDYNGQQSPRNDRKFTGLRSTDSHGTSSYYSSPRKNLHPNMQSKMSEETFDPSSLLVEKSNDTTPVKITKQNTANAADLVIEDGNRLDLLAAKRKSLPMQLGYIKMMIMMEKSLTGSQTIIGKMNDSRPNHTSNPLLRQE